MLFLSPAKTYPIFLEGPDRQLGKSAPVRERRARKGRPHGPVRGTEGPATGTARLLMRNTLLIAPVPLGV